MRGAVARVRSNAYCALIGKNAPEDTWELLSGIHDADEYAAVMAREFEIIERAAMRDRWARETSEAAMIAAIGEDREADMIRAAYVKIPGAAAADVEKARKDGIGCCFLLYGVGYCVLVAAVIGFAGSIFGAPGAWGALIVGMVCAPVAMHYAARIAAQWGRVWADRERDKQGGGI